MDEIRITLKRTFPYRPPIVYDWQIYPMRLVRYIYAVERGDDYLTVLIYAWIDDSRTCEIEIGYKDIFSVTLRPEELKADVFYRAQEIVYRRILASSPIQGCDLPPSTEYKPCHCGADCDFQWRNERYGESCWGEVDPGDVPDDGQEWTHACKGHMPIYDGEEYKEKPE